MKTRILFLAACLMAGFSGCSKSDDVVQWPALREMDDWAEKGEGWAEDGKLPEMRQALPDIAKAGQKLLASPVPANAKDPAAVTQTLSELRDVFAQLAKSPLADEDLKVGVAGIHPLVEKLMAVAGMPHVHEHPDKDAKK